MSVPWQDKVMVRHITSSGDVLVGTSIGEVWCSRDEGQTWKEVRRYPVEADHERIALRWQEARGIT